MWNLCHYNDAIMSAMASQIASLTIVYSTVYAGLDQRKHQSWPITRKMFPFDDVIMVIQAFWRFKYMYVLTYFEHNWRHGHSYSYTLCFVKSVLVSPSELLLDLRLTRNKHSFVPKLCPVIDNWGALGHYSQVIGRLTSSYYETSSELEAMRYAFRIIQ